MNVTAFDPDPPSSPVPPVLSDAIRPGNNKATVV